MGPNVLFTLEELYWFLLFEFRYGRIIIAVPVVAATRHKRDTSYLVAQDTMATIASTTPEKQNLTEVEIVLPYQRLRPCAGLASLANL